MFNVGLRYQQELGMTNGVSTPANVGTITLDKNISEVYLIDYSMKKQYANGITVGKFDYDFASNIVTSIGRVQANQAGVNMVFQSTGKFIGNGLSAVTSGFIPTATVIGRFFPSGILDTTFKYSNFNGQNACLAVNPSDDSLIIAGPITGSFGGVAKGGLYKVDANGVALDSTWETNLGATRFNSNVDYVTIQPDGKVLVGGRFTTFKGVAQNRLVRLNADGTTDTAFNTNIGTAFSTSGSNGVMCIKVQTDGKILIGGQFTAWNGSTTSAGLIRLNSDGTLDTTFTTTLTTTFCTSTVTDIQIDTSGNIYLRAAGSNWQGITNIGTVIKISSSGVIDTTFRTNLGTGVPGLGLAVSESMKLLPDGSILISTGNNAGIVNGVTVKWLAHISATGILDTSLTPFLVVPYVVSGSPNQMYLSSTGDSLYLFGSSIVGPGNIQAGSNLQKVGWGTGYTENLICEGQLRAVYSPSSNSWTVTNTVASGVFGIDSFSSLIACGTVFSVNTSGQLQYTNNNIQGTKISDIFRFRVQPL